MKATVKVSHLSTGDKDYVRNDAVDLSDDEMAVLAPFVERVVPTVVAIDERDHKITELESTIESLSADLTSRNLEITKMKKEISARQREIQKLLKEK